MMFVGFDASEMYLDTMRYRRIHGLVVQNSFLMGELGVRTLADHLNGKSVQKRIDITPVMVTPDNIDRPEIQRLLHLPPAAWFIQRDGTDRAFKNAKTRTCPAGSVLSIILRRQNGPALPPPLKRKAADDNVRGTSSGGVLLLLAVAAVARPWHGFETHLGNRLLTHLAHSVRPTSHPPERLVDRS